MGSQNIMENKKRSIAFILIIALLITLPSGMFIKSPVYGAAGTNVVNLASQTGDVSIETVGDQIVAYDSSKNEIASDNLADGEIILTGTMTGKGVVVTSGSNQEMNITLNNATITNTSTANNDVCAFLINDKTTVNLNLVN